MSTFEKTLKLAAKSIGLLPGAERITYIPATGSSRTIKAVVQREPNEEFGGLTPEIIVLVENDSTRGIASDEVNTGGDKLKLAKRTDKVPVLVRIAQIMEHDAGFMKLGCG